MNHSPHWKIEGEGLEITSIPGQNLTLEWRAPHARGKLVFLQPGVRMGLYASLSTLVLTLLILGFAFRASFRKMSP